MPLSAEKTVGEIAAAFPAAVRILEKHHIDYYSARSHPFRDACRVAGVCVEQVLEEVRRSAGGQPDWNNIATGELIQHLVNAHHVWLSKDLPWIEHLIGRASSMNRENRSIPALQRVFLKLQVDLRQHLRREEDILFPAILKLERAVAAGRGATIAPADLIEQDHEIDAQLWDELREVAYGYVTDEDAPQSIRALYQELGKLEAAVHRHTHLENNVLFPRVNRLLQPRAHPTGQA